MKTNKSLPYLIFVISLFFCLISFNFLTEGMFMDGLYYSCISHKIADGQCTFWHLTDLKSNSFYGHPPLALHIQGCFLKIFGDNYYCDKIYSVLTYLITGLIICLIWKRTTGETKSAWMPLLFWITISLTLWGATNNMLENTMSIFIAASVFFCLNDDKPYISSILSGVMIFLAFMVKGPTSLFPIAFPIIQYFFQKDKPIWKYILKTFIITITSITIFTTMLLLSEDSKYFFKMYYNIQIQGSLEIVTVSNRFYIIWRWFREMLVGIAIISISYIIKHKKQTLRKLSHIKTDLKGNPPNLANVMESLKFLLLGLCGVIPIIVTMKQRGFYIIPTLPFFAISMALIFRMIFKNINSIAANIIASVVFVAAIVLNVTNFGIISRDKKMLNDIHVFEKIIPRNEKILIPKSLDSEYSLFGYYLRYFDSALSTKDENNKFLIMPKEEQYDEQRWQSKYKLSDLKTEKFNLYINESFN